MSAPDLPIDVIRLIIADSDSADWMTFLRLNKSWNIAARRQLEFASLDDNCAFATRTVTSYHDRPPAPIWLLLNIAWKPNMSAAQYMPQPPAWITADSALPYVELAEDEIVGRPSIISLIRRTWKKITVDDCINIVGAAIAGNHWGLALFFINKIAAVVDHLRVRNNICLCFHKSIEYVSASSYGEHISASNFWRGSAITFNRIMKQGNLRIINPWKDTFPTEVHNRCDQIALLWLAAAHQPGALLSALVAKPELSPRLPPALQSYINRRLVESTA